MQTHLSTLEPAGPVEDDSLAHATLSITSSTSPSARPRLPAAHLVEPAAQTTNQAQQEPLSAMPVKMATLAAVALAMQLPHSCTWHIYQSLRFASCVRRASTIAQGPPRPAAVTPRINRACGRPADALRMTNSAAHIRPGHQPTEPATPTSASTAPVRTSVACVHARSMC